MVRPRRLYINSKGKYYYLIDGKKKYVKVPEGMSQKQVQTVNIKNIIGTTGRRLRRKKKIKRPRYTEKVVRDMQESTGLPGYIFKPKRKILSLSQIIEGSESNDKNIIDLLKDAFLVNKPAVKADMETQTIGLPPVERVSSKSTPLQRNLFSSVFSEGKDDDKEIEIPQGVAEEKEEEEEEEKKDKRTFFQRLTGRKKKQTKMTDFVKLEKRKKEGKGHDNSDDGLYNDEIEKIMKERLNLTVPVIASDQIDTLPNYLYNKNFFSAVINTDPSESDGRHWRCIVIDNRDDFPSAEYFDPLAETSKPEPALIEVMRKLCKIMNPEKYMKYKFSKIRRQAYNKSNCGYHCMKYIEDRYNGIPFEEASGYKDYIKRMKGKGAPDDSQDGEGDLASYEKKIKSEFKEYL